VVFSILDGHEDDPPLSMLALRLMGAVHRLVLRGDAPELAAHYPSAGGRPDDPWPAFSSTLAGNAAELRILIEDPVQTNEPGRCAALLPGFLEVSERTGLPLRLLEVGASAGLNLRFDRYHYELPGRAWGPRDSPLTLRAELTGAAPLETGLAVASRAGCDARPIDPTSEEGRLTLASYLWADQPERLARLRAACTVAAETPVPVARASAAAWTNEALAAAAPGTATVVFHSIVMQYLPDDERAEFESAVRAAGERAVATAPVAWLRMEPADVQMAELRLTLWPGGRETLLASVGYHGDPVLWAG